MEKANAEPGTAWSGTRYAPSGSWVSWFVTAYTMWRTMPDESQRAHRATPGDMRQRATQRASDGHRALWRHSLGDPDRGRTVRSRIASVSCRSPAQKSNVPISNRSRNRLTIAAA